MPQHYNYELLWEIAQAFGNSFGRRKNITFSNIIPMSELLFPLDVTRQALALLILSEKERETVELLCANYMNLPLVVPDEIYEQIVNMFGTIELNASEKEHRDWTEKISEKISQKKISQSDLDYWVKLNKSISDRSEDALLELQVLKNIAGIAIDADNE